MAKTIKDEPVKQLIIDVIERLTDELYVPPAGSDGTFLKDNFKASLIAKVRNTDLTSAEDITVPAPVVKEDEPSES